MHPDARDRSRRMAALWIVLAGFAAAFASGLALRLAGLSSDAAMFVPPIVALFAWFLVARRRWRELGLPRSRPGPGWRWGLVSYLVAAACASATLLLLGGESPETPIDTTRVLQAVIMVVLVAGIATGLAEEVAIRGALLALLRERVGAVLAIAVSSVLFAVMHIPNMMGWGLTLPAALLTLLGHLVFGAALGYLVVRTGSLWMAIGWHAGSNGVWVGVSALTGANRPEAGLAADLLETGAEALAIVLLADLARRMRPGRDSGGQRSPSSAVGAQP